MDPLELTNGGKTFRKKGYDIPVTNKNSIVVRQVSIKQDNGGVYEVPNTEVIQAYSEQDYQRLLDINFFADNQLKAEIIHQPK